MEMDNKLATVKGDPQLSGAYIRSFVKQLASSRTKNPMNPDDHPDSAAIVLDGDDAFPAHHQNVPKLGETQTSQPSQQPLQHKKQVRRRLHNTRPYQERLINMAEARREIVTALKFHRAAMKQANEHQHQQSPQAQAQPLQPSPEPEQEVKSKFRKKPRSDTSTANSTTNNLMNFVDNLSYQPLTCHPPQNTYAWPMSPATPQPIPENSNFSLPSQALGLNLNLHDFNDNNLDTTLFYNPLNYYSPSSPSTSFPLLAAMEEIPYMEISQAPSVADPVIINEEDLSLHHAMDDEEMAEIRSLGEQYQIEWDDTLNLVTSAWWFKFLKNMETAPGGKLIDDETLPYDEVMEFPARLDANDIYENQLHDHCSGYYFQEPALTCMDMDIREIEGMDGEWLA